MTKLKTEKDPFFGLKFIAYCRTGLSLADEDIDEEAMLAFAKWQICKTRNILWNDPIWDLYTSPEIMTEYFSIKFDENEDLRKEFHNNILEVTKGDLDWFQAMEQEYMAKSAPDGTQDPEVIAPNSIIEGVDSIRDNALTSPEEFEDTFNG